MTQETRPLGPLGGRELLGNWPLFALAKFWIARPSCRRLLLHDVRRAASRADWTAGSRSPISVAMIAITTSSSTRVKPCGRRARRCRDGETMECVFISMISWKGERTKGFNCMDMSVGVVKPGPSRRSTAESRLFGPFDLDDDAVLDDREDRTVLEAVQGVADPAQRRFGAGRLRLLAAADGALS